MLGTARLLGQSTGAALVALMLNQLGDARTHSRRSRRRSRHSRGGSERFTYYATTRSGKSARHSDALFIRPVRADYFRYSPLRSASMRSYPAAARQQQLPLNDFDLPLIQNVMLVASVARSWFLQAPHRGKSFFTVNQLRRIPHRHENSR